MSAAGQRLDETLGQDSRPPCRAPPSPPRWAYPGGQRAGRGRRPRRPLQAAGGNSGWCRGMTSRLVRGPGEGAAGAKRCVLPPRLRGQEEDGDLADPSHFSRRGGAPCKSAVPAVVVQLPLPAWNIQALRGKLYHYGLPATMPGPLRCHRRRDLCPNLPPCPRRRGPAGWRGRARARPGAGTASAAGPPRPDHNRLITWPARDKRPSRDGSPQSWTTPVCGAAQGGEAPPRRSLAGAVPNRRNR